MARSAGCARLIAVALARRRCDDDDDQLSQAEVQNELTTVVQTLSFNGRLTIDRVRRPRQETIPLLAVNGLGNRRVIARGGEDTTEYLVEECEVDDGVWVRRLYFVENPNVIQSETAVVNCHGASSVDPLRLRFEYHVTIVAGFMALLDHHHHTTNVLVIGVGGGGLISFFDRFFVVNSDMDITAVESDRNVVDIAVSHFGFRATIICRRSGSIGGGLSKSFSRRSMVSSSSGVMVGGSFSSTSRVVSSSTSECEWRYSSSSSTTNPWPWITFWTPPVPRRTLLPLLSNAGSCAINSAAVKSPPWPRIPLETCKKCLMNSVTFN